MITDEALFAELVGGDVAAFDALYARHGRHLFGFILTHVASRAEAEELLQETFLVVLRESKKGRRTESFRGWLFQVARNACLNRLRSRRRSDAALAQLPDGDAPVPPEVALLSHEAAHGLERAVSRLPTALAELYHLRARGLSYAELAEVLDVPLGTIKSRLHELVSRLKQEMTS
jgi:RNA polymerase sigma-70 factor (ECF subfamily)